MTSKVTREKSKKITKMGHRLLFHPKIDRENPSMTNQNLNYNQGEPNFLPKIKILIRDQHPEKLETPKGIAFFS